MHSSCSLIVVVALLPLLALCADEDLMPTAGLSSAAKPCWTPWSLFGGCTATCGPSGIRTRTRNCLCRNCDGVGKETQPCNRVNCSPIGVWGQWSGYSPCSVTCGRGTRTRTRKCIGVGCVGPSTNMISCVQPPCGYTWSKWSCTRCSRPCNGGYQTCSRHCQGPAPVPPGACIGYSYGTRKCNTFPCKSNTVGTPIIAGGEDVVDGEVMPGTRLAPNGQTLISAAPLM